MVSFWPWRGEDISPASFEKALSALSVKISKTGAQLEALRQKSRRLKALWTVYTSFAYILYTIVLALVQGWRTWGYLEYGAVIGGPIIIILVRYLFTAYYNYRTSNVAARLQDLQKERETTIDKLKAATKYNSTQELLEKYGGVTPTKSPSSGANQKGKIDAQDGNPKGLKGGQQGVQRTGFAPPPTANIVRNPSMQQPPATPQQQQAIGRNPDVPDLPSMPPNIPLGAAQVETTEEFAPNAFGTQPQYSSESVSEHRWYDRLMDVLLGEDETLPKNRLALICQNCRLVNGQAAPGVKQLSDVGPWRCAGCGTMNGEESEAKRIVEEVQAKADIQGGRGLSKETEISEDDLADSEGGGEHEGIEIKPEDDEVGSSTKPRRRSKRSTKAT